MPSDVCCHHRTHEQGPNHQQGALLATQREVLLTLFLTNIITTTMAVVVKFLYNTLKTQDLLITPVNVLSTRLQMTYHGHSLYVV